MKKCSIGGQGVLEGVMMRAPKHSALAVRKETGEIVTQEWDNKQRTGKFANLPVVRGVVSFVDMLIVGVSTISDSAKLYDESNSAEYEPSRFEKFVAKKTGKNAMDVMLAFAVVLGIALAIGLFFFLPTLITGWLSKFVSSALGVNLLEGLVRLVIFLGYLLAVRLMKDIRRVFGYHGAEHKTIHCYENELPLSVENVRKQSRLHPRCGTSYLLIIMVLTIIIYSFLGWNQNLLLRFGTRLLLLPLIAGLSYEFLKFAASSEHILLRILRWPGLQLQRLTTAQPDDSMIECAIVAFQMAAGLPKEELDALITSYDRSAKKPSEEAEPEDVPAAPLEETSEEAEADEAASPEQTAKEAAVAPEESPLSQTPETDAAAGSL